MIAQELEKSFPELVHRGGSGTLKSHRLDQSGIWSVDYSKLGAIALAGVKELNQMVEAISATTERSADTQTDLNDLRRLVQRQADEITELRSRITRMEQVRVRTAAR